MRYLARFSPIRAIQDLRLFLASRERYELAFLFLSIVLTTLLIAGFVKDSRVERPYKREIVYVENWRADRSDAEIKADQLRGMATRTKLDAMQEKALADRKASFQRVDDKLTSWGL
ncbi:hypothetical protein ASE86_00020 [Sphingomonas sp. Leaf33]|uniref:hypothetical protein n=1 Tax=Sphingomonas sp. Leaf33 TaxID=1736215 RepID=UPI0007014E0C|nr:hypothetical protein [Sphingomonas sp. Leaf33]KQN24736.1 hypothetical protein ASE86_00020 [Sphingomonas sp. Leaf33]